MGVVEFYWIEKINSQNQFISSFCSTVQTKPISLSCRFRMFGREKSFVWFSLFINNENNSTDNTLHANVLEIHPIHLSVFHI